MSQLFLQCIRMGVGDLKGLNDCRNTNRERGVDLLPIEIVIQQSKNLNLSILAMQELPNVLVKENWKELSQKLDGEYQQDRVLELLREAGYCAEIVKLTRANLMTARLGGLAKAMEKFAHNPRIIKPNQNN